MKKFIDINTITQMYNLLHDFCVIDDMKAQSKIHDNDAQYMKALYFQENAVEAAKNLLARIDDECKSLDSAS